MTFWELFKRMLVSWTRLPPWVLIWVFVFLGPVNIAALFFLDTNTGKYAAIAMIIAFSANGFLMIANGGVSKVMAVPHLIAWIPLEIYLIWQLFFTDNLVPGSGEHWLAGLLLIINGISLVFDVYDTKEWRAGNRAITGFPEAEVRY